MSHGQSAPGRAGSIRAVAASDRERRPRVCGRGPVCFVRTMLAVVLVSLVFTLLHYSPHQPPLVMASTVLFSLFACAWVLRSGNLWGVMGWHAGWNWLLAVGFELPVTGLDAHLPALLVALRPQGGDALTGGTQGPEGSVLCVVFFALALAWMLVRARKGRAGLPAPGLR